MEARLQRIAIVVSALLPALVSAQAPDPEQPDADTAQHAEPPRSPPPQAPQGPRTEPAPETRGDEERLLGSRWGAVGRLAGSLSGSLQSTSDSGLHGGLSAGGGVRFALFAPQDDRVYLGPAVALLVDAQLSNLFAAGLEARLEFLVVSPGGMLQPWFNVWLSGGVRAAIDRSVVRPTEWVGVGIGGNVFSNGFGWLFGTNLGGGGSFYGVVATAVGMAIIGLLHFEARLEAIDGSDLLYHFIIGVGF